MDKYTNKKLFYAGLFLIILFILVGIIIINSSKNTTPLGYNFPTPEEVVQHYFITWNNKDYANMYSTFSDGFKRIEPTAKDLATFRKYAESQGIKAIKIININEKSNDGKTASVDYSVEFTLKNNEKRKFKDTFTLKFRSGDIIQGWKLIHPYGENIDES